jgi:hypothetical protein
MIDMSNTIESLLEKVTLMEKRPLSEHVDLEEVEPLWPLVSKEGVMHSMTKRLIELAFDHGGFIAGGFGRWSATSNRSAIERGQYFACGGDIDLFFHSRDGWSSYLLAMSKIDSVDKMLSSVGVSQGSLAINMFPRVVYKKEHTYNFAPKIQAIGCAVGTPKQILRSFDFVNCMFSMDAKSSWAATKALDLEKAGVLGVSSWSSRGLVHRLMKYHIKYGYSRCRDMSGGRRLEHMYNAAGSHVNDMSGLYSASHWASFLKRTTEDFFEDDSVCSDILTCAVLPFDGAGPFTMSVAQTGNRAETNSTGTYKNGLNSLLERERKAKSITVEDYERMLDNIRQLELDDDIRLARMQSVRETTDPPSWTAEQYCWSF